jgi:hypothetical protein
MIQKSCRAAGVDVGVPRCFLKNGRQRFDIALNLIIEVENHLGRERASF